MSNQIRKKTIRFDETYGEPIFSALSWLFSWKKSVPNAHSTRQAFKNILLIRPGGIGDYLLSIPAFKGIRAAYPSAHLTLFLFSRNKNCLELYNDFDQVIIIDKPLNLMKFLMRFKKYDLSIDFDQYRKIPSILSMLSWATARIGFDKNGKGKAYTDPVAYRDNEYEAQSFMNLLAPLGQRTEVSKGDLMVKTQADAEKSRKKIPYSVAIYAAAMKEDNRLTISAWADIFRQKGNDFTYYFIGGTADRERYDELQKHLGGMRIERRDGVLSLSETIDFLGSMEAMLSEDGGAYHMGVAAGIPIKGYWLHGESNMKKWGSPHAENILI